MKFSAVFKVELHRLLHTRSTWLLAALCLLAPLAGYGLVKPTMGDTMSALFLADPMLTGGLAATFLFGLMMLFSLHKPSLSGIGSMTDAICSPLSLCVARLLVVLTVGMLAALAVGLAYLPYTAWKLNIVFSMGEYWLSILLFVLSGMVMGALAASLLWQVFHRLDVSLLALGAAVIISRSELCAGSFLAQWCIPLVSTLSDAFGSAIVWRTALYSRLTWLCLLGGGWGLSLRCVRQYGKGVFGSFARHLRLIAIPVAAAVLIGCGALLWVKQPFVDHSPADWMEQMMAQQQEEESTPLLTLQSTQLELQIESYLLGTVRGKGVYAIVNPTGAPQELTFDISSGYSVRSVLANGIAIPFEDLNNDFIANKQIRCTLPADKNITLQIEYGGMPQIWKEQEYELSTDTVSAKGIMLTSKALSPVVTQGAMADENGTVSLQIDLKKELVPVSTGKQVKVRENADGTITWQIQAPQTERLLLYAGDYAQTMLDTGDGSQIPFYYSAKYSPRLQNGALDLMEGAVAYCTKQYGAKANAEQGFKIVQLPAFIFGGYAVEGLSGMGESYFSDQNLNNTEKGSNSAEILAHEIIHQWWGLSAMLMDMEDTNWNEEGITVYSTYRFMRERMGEAYANENYVARWEQTMAKLERSFYRRNPAYLDLLPEVYRNALLSEESGARWYDGNALLIHKIAQKIGEDKLDAVWAQLYTQGGTQMPPYISLTDFLDACGLTKGDVGLA